MQTSTPTIGMSSGLVVAGFPLSYCILRIAVNVHHVLQVALLASAAAGVASLHIVWQPSVCLSLK